MFNFILIDCSYFINDVCGNNYTGKRKYEQILLSATITSMTLSMTSCATILTGTKDSITFNSAAEGAIVMHKGAEKCTTPCTVEVPRVLGKQTAHIQKEGYDTTELKLEKNFNAVTMVNILLGGVIGFGVDLGTGSFLKYDQKSYTVPLKTKP